MTESKQAIRKRILEARAGLSAAERERAALLVTERILGHQWFYRCRDFLCFAGYGSEIATDELLAEALRLGKRTYVPRVEPQAAEPTMYFARIASMEDLTAGYKGIPEPQEDAERYSFSRERAERTLMIMPGVAFDGTRNRIGYGCGFYDRYLAGKEALQLHTIAIGFRCQLVEHIPAQENDIRPYQVICC